MGARPVDGERAAGGIDQLNREQMRIGLLSRAPRSFRGVDAPIDYQATWDATVGAGIGPGDTLCQLAGDGAFQATQFAMMTRCSSNMNEIGTRRAPRRPAR